MAFKEGKSLQTLSGVQMPSIAIGAGPQDAVLPFLTRACLMGLTFPHPSLCPGL